MDAIRYEFDSAPAAGETRTIADGVTWVRLPLPFQLNHINIWLLRDERGWAIVDTGLGTSATRNIWRGVFTDGMQNDPAAHVVVTHLHPDHAGCANWLVDEFDAELWMTREEYLLCRVLIADTGKPPPDEGIRFYHAAGFSAEHLAVYTDNFGMFGKVVTGMPNSHRRIQDGDAMAFDGHDWEVIVGRGHSPEHACLYDRQRNLLISGDQILPTISPNVSVWPTEPFANPLRDFFDSIERLEELLPEDVLVLPAHGKPFRGVHERLKALRAEHVQRLDILLENGREPRRVVDVFPDLFGRAINNNNRIMATGEALAHLRYLVASGDMIATADSDHVTWFARS